MKLKQWIKNWLNADQSNNIPYPSTKLQEDHRPDTSKSLTFNIWFANGGKIIQTSRYDKIKDRHISNLYVIQHEANFGEEIDKILTMESLRS